MVMYRQCITVLGFIAHFLTASKQLSTIQINAGVSVLDSHVHRGAVWVLTVRKVSNSLLKC